MKDREVLLDVAKWFVEQARLLACIERIALIGSICTNKETPKDIDFLISIRPGTDLQPVAKLTRQLKGRIQKGSLGADVFIVENGRYVGRGCHYRESWPRVVCRQSHLKCASNREFLCDTSANFIVNEIDISHPALVLWPDIKINAILPDDVITCFGLSKQIAQNQKETHEDHQRA